MGNRLNKSDFTIVLESTVLTLMKLRKSKVTRLSRVSIGVFRCILEYCEPTRIKRVSKHYKYNTKFPINYTWPKQASYLNPVSEVRSDGACMFRLQSGEQTYEDGLILERKAEREFDRELIVDELD